MDIQKFKTSVLKPAIIIMMNKPSLEFLGFLSYGIKIRVQESSILKKLGIPALGYTDGELITLFALDILSAREVAFIICHEIWHIISMHVDRRFDRDPIIWNLCADHVTNRNLKEYADKGVFDMPKNTIFFEDIHSKHPTISTESLYKMLYKEWPKFKVQIYSAEGKGDKEDKGDKDDQSSSGMKVAKITDPNGKNSVISIDCDIGNHKNSQKVKKACQKLSNQAKMLWNSSIISKGDMPGNLVQELDDILKIELPWDEIYDRSITYYAQNFISHSWKEKDFYYPHLTLPGRSTGEEVQIAIFVIDSSGSISDYDLKRFIGVTCSASNCFDKIVILIHDVEIHGEFWFLDRPNETEIFDEVKKIHGRGGTSHKEIFNRIEEICEEELISVTVFLTDYYSDVESIYGEYGWFKEIPSIWIVNNELTPNFGDSYDCKVIKVK